MSRSAQLARLEALLARVTARRAEPRVRLALAEAAREEPEALTHRPGPRAPSIEPEALTHRPPPHAPPVVAPHSDAPTLLPPGTPPPPVVPPAALVPSFPTAPPAVPEFSEHASERPTQGLPPKLPAAGALPAVPAAPRLPAPSPLPPPPSPAPAREDLLALPAADDDVFPPVLDPEVATQGVVPGPGFDDAPTRIRESAPLPSPPQETPEPFVAAAPEPLVAAAPEPFVAAAPLSAEPERIDGPALLPVSDLVRVVPAPPPVRPASLRALLERSLALRPRNS